ncbi:hypothetical protein J6590_049577 [Homalodisca vitripennis]|nr:hypothetical protein J6590_049577 [Homalodisca vitripennis]
MNVTYGYRLQMVADGQCRPELCPGAETQVLTVMFVVWPDTHPPVACLARQDPRSLRRPSFKFHSPPRIGHGSLGSTLCERGTLHGHIDCMGSSSVLYILQGKGTEHADTPCNLGASSLCCGGGGGGDTAGTPVLAWLLADVERTRHSQRVGGRPLPDPQRPNNVTVKPT